MSFTRNHVLGVSSACFCSSSSSSLPSRSCPHSSDEEAASCHFGPENRLNMSLFSVGGIYAQADSSNKMRNALGINEVVFR